jgi:hypothetical protein
MSEIVLKISERQLLVMAEMMTVACKVGCFVGEADFDALAMEYRDSLMHVMQTLADRGAAEVTKQAWTDPPFLPMLSQEYLDSSYGSEAIASFREESFWEELVMRMSERDVIHEIGENAWDALSDDEQLERSEARRLFYEREINQHGIDRFFVINSVDEG